MSTAKKPTDCSVTQREFCESRFDRLDKDGARREVKMDNLAALISGNGEPGLNERVRTIEAAYLHESEERGKLRTSARRTFWTVIGSAAVLIVTYFWNMFTRRTP